MSRHRSAQCATGIVLVGFLVIPSASAHVVPVPQFVATGAVTTISFAVPNERPEAMSAVVVTVPSGFRIVRAHATPGWAATVDGSTATWRGGPLAHLTVETFRLDAEVSADPGPAGLTTRELYPSGAAVDWPATLTVIPGADDGQSEGTGRGWVAAIVGISLTFPAALALLAWRRRTPPQPSR